MVEKIIVVKGKKGGLEKLFEINNEKTTHGWNPVEKKIKKLKIF